MAIRMTALLAAMLLMSAVAPPVPAAQESPAAGGGTDAPADTTKTPGGEGPAARIEKQLTIINDRLTALQKEEFDLTMNIMKAQQKANEGLENPSKAAEELSKGNKSRELMEYKSIMVSCAQQVQAFDGKFFPLIKAVKGLEKERPHAPAELQPKIDDAISRVALKHRTNLEKAGDLYEKAAEWRMALQAYLSIIQALPPEKQKAERTLREKIAGLYDKCGDSRNSALIYKQLFESIPQKDRMKNRELGEKLAGQYEKLGELKAALELYKGLLEAMPADKREKDGKGLKDKIAAIEKKLGKGERAANT